jgi:hypothetical protein
MSDIRIPPVAGPMYSRLREHAALMNTYAQLQEVRGASPPRSDPSATGSVTKHAFPIPLSRAARCRFMRQVGAPVKKGKSIGDLDDFGGTHIENEQPPKVERIPINMQDPDIMRSGQVSPRMFANPGLDAGPLNPTRDNTRSFSIGMAASVLIRQSQNQRAAFLIWNGIRGK